MRLSSAKVGTSRCSAPLWLRDSGFECRLARFPRLFNDLPGTVDPGEGPVCRRLLVVPCRPALALSEEEAQDDRGGLRR